MHNGPIPEGMQIDHINGNKLDNRIENLRLATQSQQKYNVGVRKSNKQQLKNIFYMHFIDKKNGKLYEYWTVRIQSEHKILSKNFPYTDEGLQQAIEWRDAKLIELHGEYANHG